MNLLAGEAPLALFKIDRVLYWGRNTEQKLDFTTMDDTAACTAEVALESDAPRDPSYLRQQISAAELAKLASEINGKSFHLLRGGGLERLRRMIEVARRLRRSPMHRSQIWQGMQYLYCMYDGSGMLSPVGKRPLS